MIDTQKRIELEGQFKLHERDTGSVELQVIQLTDRILQLTEHAKINPKDFSSKRGLLKLVNRRRKFLEYIKEHKENVYRNLVQNLGLRK